MTTQAARGANVDVDEHVQLARVAKQTLQFAIPVTFGVAIAASAATLTLKWASIGLIFFAACIVVGVGMGIADGKHGQADPGTEKIGYIAITALWIVALVASSYFAVRGESGWWAWGTFCVASGISCIILFQTRIWQNN
jgi:hypothetical protein